MALSAIIIPTKINILTDLHTNDENVLIQFSHFSCRCYRLDDFVFICFFIPAVKIGLARPSLKPLETNTSLTSLNSNKEARAFGASGWTSVAASCSVVAAGAGDARTS